MLVEGLAGDCLLSGLFSGLVNIRRLIRVHWRVWAVPLPGGDVMLGWGQRGGVDGRFLHTPAASARVTAVLSWHRVVLRKLFNTPWLYIIIIISPRVDLHLFWCILSPTLSGGAPQTPEQQTNIMRQQRSPRSTFICLVTQGGKTDCITNSFIE